MKPTFASACGALLLISFAGGCSKTASGPGTPANTSGASTIANSASAPAQSDRDAIAGAIQRHLNENKGINMAAMDMNLTDVNVNADQAQANAEFRLKQGGTSMVMTYFLERHAGGWIVVRNQPGGGQFAHPPMDKIHSGAGPPSEQPQMPDVADFLKKQPQTGTPGSSH
ncbi:MAG TPA: hypothetical protein VJO53_05205 [Candidatus Acidoferrales bacterium]|nr:hypothetical protein [Candidatus Acidoferrales bacterium]